MFGERVVEITAAAADKVVGSEIFVPDVQHQEGELGALEIERERLLELGVILCRMKLIRKKKAKGKDLGGKVSMFSPEHL